MSVEIDQWADDHNPIERRLAQALRDAEVVPPPTLAVICEEQASSADLFQLAWDRAEQEIDKLQAELRLMRQRHQEAERDVLTRINRRKRLKQQILESTGASNNQTVG